MGDKREWAGVRAASKGSIEIVFMYKGTRCRERVKLLPSPSNLKKAFYHRVAIMASIESGTFNYAMVFPDSPSRFKFAEYKGDGYLLSKYLSDWLNSQKKHLHSSTHEGYAKIVNSILIPVFGSKTISELQRVDVKKWCDDQECGNKRLANVQSVLRSALNAAIDDLLIETSPMNSWTYKKQEAPKVTDDIDPLSIEDQALLLDSCKDPQHKNLFQFAFWTGLRTSELVALEWGDIDWNKGTVKISKAKTQAANDAETPKTKRGARLVTLLEPAIEALLAQKPYSFMKVNIIFLNPYSGEQWTGDQKIRENAWLPAIRKAGIRYRNPYQTRHTYASMMLTAGESPIWLAGQMGHSDTTMIFRNYGRWINNKDANSGAKAVAMFSPKRKTLKAV